MEESASQPPSVRKEAANDHVCAVAVTMEMSTFNVDDGFLEAMARGYRGRIMTRDDYQALIQSETLEDLKMHLSSTEFDYTKELEALQVRT